MNPLFWTMLSAVIAVGPTQDNRKLADQCRPAIARAVAYLQKAKNDDGSFGDGDLQTPVTALVVAGLLQAKAVPSGDPLVVRGLAFLQSKIEPDGSMKAGRAGKNYTTSICLMAFAAANKEKKYQEIVDRAIEYLKKEQWDEGEGIDAKDARFGGVGYGGKSRPDLSVTSFMLDALHSAGLPDDDPAFQRAQLFVRRCQNLSGEGANDLAIGDGSNDGGFFYTPVSQERRQDAESLRSYGSMTYAGLKSFLYAGVRPDDFRVQAARKWIAKHYTLEENPGQGGAGLYYYYHTFAKALAALELDALVDDKDQTHDWRTDLVQALLSRQRPDGSWVNADRRWMETDPRLATAYALLSLAQAIGEPSKR